MRKLRDRASPTDPDAYYAVDGLWPTVRGTYETCTLLASQGYSQAINSSGGGGGSTAGGYHAYIGTREYLVGNKAIYSQVGGVFTDRTNGGNVPVMLADYGTVTIGCCSVSFGAVFSTGTTFSPLTGAPQAEIVVTCANAVLMFNSSVSTDSWHASDVGDYTNWTTGEAASGRLIQTPGQIIAACAFGENTVYVWKTNSIYRGRYVGGPVKWAWEVVVHNVGMNPSGGTGQVARFSLAAGIDRMMFVGALDNTHFATAASGKQAGAASRSYFVYTFDGVNPPQLCNPETTIAFDSSVRGLTSPEVLHDPISDMFCVTAFNIAYFYNVRADAWGQKSALMSGIATDANFRSSAKVTIPIRGDVTKRTNVTPMPEFYAATSITGSGNIPVTWTRYTLDTTLANIGDHYVQTSMVGRSDAKTYWDRVLAKMRRRNGTGTAALSATYYREDANTTAETTLAIAESTIRNRFDISGSGSSDNFARFKVTWNAIDVEVEDVVARPKSTSAE